MPILTQVGRKSIKMRLVTVLLYTILAVGGVTMVMPFVMTVGDSFRTPGDDDEHNLFPSFFFDDAWLYRKYVCIKHGELSNYGKHVRADFAESREIPFHATHPGDAARVEDYAKWKTSLAKKNPTVLRVLFLGRGGANTVQMWRVAGRYIDFLHEKYGTIDALNTAYGTGFSAFDNVLHPKEQTDLASWAVRSDMQYFRDWQEFKQRLPADALFPVSMDHRYQLFLRAKLESIDGVNAAFGTSFESLEDIRMPVISPANQAHSTLWLEFAAHRLPPRFFDWGPDHQAAWKAFVAKRFGSWQGYVKYREREITKAKMSEEDSVPRTPDEPTGVRSVDKLFGEFVRSLDLQTVRLGLPEVLFADYLREKYGTTEQLNIAYQSDYTKFDLVEFPTVAEDRACFERQKKEVFWEVIKRNYVIVINYLIVNSRSAWVTLLLCAASVASALIINPLAAYALSRYDLKIGYHVLIFFLATMAFPMEVSMIPNFLMLKELGLLNTLWALFLPGAANGYSIFLLKGFFDSIPKEIFEAADLDGASELTIFSRIVMPCSKPVLAVIALGAFTAAYSSFMWAFVVCQDPDWWTIMVYMFKLSNSGVHQGVRVAAILVTSLPTFLVFVFCQNLILRGIVIPQMK